MTYNIGGGRRDFGSQLDKVSELVRQLQPGVLALQEATAWLDADGQWHSSAEMVAEAAGGGYQVFFGPTVSLRQHFHSSKVNFVQAVQNDWLDWQFGNAILSRPGFARLSNASQTGQPHNLPIFRPVQYLGNRDTDPRHVILTRLSAGPFHPIAAATHFSTLMGERGNRHVPAKIEEAQTMRRKQAEAVLLLLETFMQREELIFLFGDLNAAANEPALQTLQNAGFVRLMPENDISTHVRMKWPVDHLLVSPAWRLISQLTWVVDTPLARQASDHLPVVADIQIK